jgi:hypothetical protein
MRFSKPMLRDEQCRDFRVRLNAGVVGNITTAKNHLASSNPPLLPVTLPEWACHRNQCAGRAIRSSESSHVLIGLHLKAPQLRSLRNSRLSCKLSSGELEKRTIPTAKQPGHRVEIMKRFPVSRHRSRWIETSWLNTRYCSIAGLAKYG